MTDGQPEKPRFPTNVPQLRAWIQDTDEGRKLVREAAGIFLEGKTASEVLDRIPPNEPTAEQSVIGSVLLEPSILGDLSKEMAVSDCYAAANETILETMYQLHTEQGPVCIESLVIKLKARGENIGGPAYLAEVIHSVAIHSHWRYFARIVRECATRRKLIYLAANMIRDAHDPQTPVVETIRAADKQIQDAYSHAREKRPGDYDWIK